MKYDNVESIVRLSALDEIQELSHSYRGFGKYLYKKRIDSLWKIVNKPYGELYREKWGIKHKVNYYD